MSMQPEVGIYCFGASVLLAMWAGERIDGTEPSMAADPEPEVAESGEVTAERVTSDLRALPTTEPAKD
jgi:hypothetical protein